jgi:hypothetical protein
MGCVFADAPSWSLLLSSLFSALALPQLDNQPAPAHFSSTRWASAPVVPVAMGSPRRNKWQRHSQSELPLESHSPAPDGRWNRSKELPNPQTPQAPEQVTGHNEPNGRRGEPIQLTGAERRRRQG